MCLKKPFYKDLMIYRGCDNTWHIQTLSLINKWPLRTGVQNKRSISAQKKLNYPLSCFRFFNLTLNKTIFFVLTDRQYFSLKALLTGTNSTIVILLLSGNADDIYRLLGFTLEKIRFIWSCREDILGLRKVKKLAISAKADIKCKKHFSILIIFFTRSLLADRFLYTSNTSHFR